MNMNFVKFMLFIIVLISTITFVYLWDKLEVIIDKEEIHPIKKFILSHISNKYLRIILIYLLIWISHLPFYISDVSADVTMFIIIVYVLMKRFHILSYFNKTNKKNIFIYMREMYYGLPNIMINLVAISCYMIIPIFLLSVIIYITPKEILNCLKIRCQNDKLKIYFKKEDYKAKFHIFIDNERKIRLLFIKYNKYISK